MTKRFSAAAVIGLATALACSWQSAFADPPSSPQVANFTLADQSGKSHELYSHVDAPMIVIATQVNGDPLSREAAKSLEELRAIFGKAEYFLLNSSTRDTAATIAAETAALGTNIPVLDDDQHAVAQALGATQTGEAYIIDPIGWKIVYHGPATAAAASDPAEQFLLFNAMVYAMSHRPMEKTVVEVKGTPIPLAAQ